MALALGMLRRLPYALRRWLAAGAVAIAVAGVITPWLFLFFLW